MKSALLDIWFCLLVVTILSILFMIACEDYKRG